MNNANPSSMRRAIRQRQQQTFVGRGVELDTFRRQLTLAADDPRRYFVLNVYGEGGVGKTTLLGAFARLGVGQGAAVALSDDSEGDAPAATPATPSPSATAPIARSAPSWRPTPTRRPGWPGCSAGRR